MSKGQRAAQDRSRERRAIAKARRRRLRKAAARSGAAATVAALAWGGLVLPPATAADGDPVLVADIAPGAGDSFEDWDMSASAALGEILLFAADDGVHGRELWRTDGTAAGTRMVKDLAPGADGSWPGAFVTFGDVVYFSARSAPGTEDGLWRTDGTAAGTTLVVPDAGVGEMYAWRGRLYFEGYDEAHGSELWSSDGTPAGTALLKDLNTRTETYEGTTHPESSSPFSFTALGDRLYFAADDGDQTELWATDGTAAGTRPVVDHPPEDFFHARRLAAVGDTLFFSGYDTNGEELWRSDGTPAGTRMVVDLAPGSDPMYGPNKTRPNNLTAFGQALYFEAFGSLWTSDGTAQGTIRVTDADTVDDIADEYGDLIATEHALYFSGHDDDHGYELWRSDGTSAGTALVQDIYPGTSPRYGREYPNSSQAHVLGRTPTRLYFTADDGSHGRELWSLSLADVPTTPGTPGTPTTPPSGAPTPSACAPATAAATTAQAEVAKAKKRLAKAKKAHRAAAVKAAKRKLRKAKKAAAAAAAAQAAACG
ncbi:ELWxxDGT repeat protein [Nocardioides nitrophenolicus]|uniref:ELWxxDGT repeat protein n=1 Tax=Nocardioides nitrophenolicus TaxID=60489 RepID=UPI001957D976|nr:ELWxxDGT repeat protein [Nocardioides nitrophenolicus]MBM7518208.1 ELWxxDGT repeat protein [Nocardioides nitrophenolicus]